MYALAYRSLFSTELKEGNIASEKKTEGITPLLQYLRDQHHGSKSPRKETSKRSKTRPIKEVKRIMKPKEDMDSTEKPMKKEANVAKGSIDASALPNGDLAVKEGAAHRDRRPRRRKDVAAQSGADAQSVTHRPSTAEATVASAPRSTESHRKPRRRAGKSDSAKV